MFLFLKILNVKIDGKIFFSFQGDWLFKLDSCQIFITKNYNLKGLKVRVKSQ